MQVTSPFTDFNFYPECLCQDELSANKFLAPVTNVPHSQYQAICKALSHSLSASRFIIQLKRNYFLCSVNFPPKLETLSSTQSLENAGTLFKSYHNKHEARRREYKSFCLF